MTRISSNADAPARGTGRIRSVAGSELIYAIGAGAVVGYSVLCAGDLDLAALDAAFHGLQVRRPYLRARVVASDIGAGLDFLDGGDRSPGRLRVFENEDPDAFATSPRATFDQAERLVQLDVLPGQGRNRVTLFVHHAIADGSHALALLQELWDRYTDHVEDTPVESGESAPFPQPVEHFLATREHPGPPPGGGGFLPPDIFPALGAAELPVLSGKLPDRVRLSQQQTQALIAFGHAEHVSLNALVSAAILRAHTEPDIFYSYPVDLRGRLAPPVDATEGTCMLGATAFRLVDSAPDLASLARRIGEQFTTELASGAVHRSASPAEGRGANPPPLGSQRVIVSSNWGRVPPLRTPQGLTITDFQSFMTPSPAIHGMARLDNTPSTYYIINSFDGRLNIEFSLGEFTAGEPAANRKLLTDIGDELRAAART